VNIPLLMVIAFLSVFVVGFLHRFNQIDRGQLTPILVGIIDAFGLTIVLSILFLGDSALPQLLLALILQIFVCFFPKSDQFFGNRFFRVMLKIAKVESGQMRVAVGGTSLFLYLFNLAILSSGSGDKFTFAEAGSAILMVSIALIAFFVYVLKNYELPQDNKAIVVLVCAYGFLGGILFHLGSMQILASLHPNLSWLFIAAPAVVVLLQKQLDWLYGQVFAKSVNGRLVPIYLLLFGLSWLSNFVLIVRYAT
jgi:hypothetical protein